MNKKLNFLAAIPLYGTIILLLWAFYKTVKGEFNRKVFTKYFVCSALVGGLSVNLIMLSFVLVNSVVDIAEFASNYGILIAGFVGGYITNAYTFTLFNKKWDNLIDKQ